MPRICIFTGGTLHPECLNSLYPSDVCIGVDQGAWFLYKNKIIPYLAIGDFDSILPEQKEILKTHIQHFLAYDPIDKDHTDTHLALEWALSQAPDEILFFGATGTRMDHTLANIFLVFQASQANIRVTFINSHNYITYVNMQLPLILQEQFGTYTSLIPLTEEVTGITLLGFQYPLHEHTLKRGQTVGISNRLIKEKGTIQIKAGIVLVVQSYD